MVFSSLHFLVLNLYLILNIHPIIFIIFFLQMSGRAGRRGLDKKGVVLVLAWDQLPDEIVFTGMLKGRIQKLESQFRLTYNMILNLLRVSDFR
jgi:antiviral helicase SKI2